MVVVTAYDYAAGQQAQAAGVDAILVGDSLGMVVLGYESTALVTLEDMIHHARAVRRGAPDTFMVVDLPFGSYQTGVNDALRASVRLVKEGMADAVKLEGGVHYQDTVRAIVSAGIPVMGHVGLLPQTAAVQGGLKVQGKSSEAAARILEDALAVEQAGAYSVVLEAVPAKLAALITSRLSIPTVGIGAGAACDGQVLVYHDLLGIFDRFRPKFVKAYAELGVTSVQALTRYALEVRERTFPGPEHGFAVKDEVLEKLY